MMVNGKDNIHLFAKNNRSKNVEQPCFIAHFAKIVRIYH